jgi:hypothetical protein
MFEAFWQAIVMTYQTVPFISSFSSIAVCTFSIERWKIYPGPVQYLRAHWSLDSFPFSSQSVAIFMTDVFKPQPPSKKLSINAGSHGRRVRGMRCGGHRGTRLVIEKDEKGEEETTL